MSREAWKVRAEAAEADKAALVQALRESCSGMRALDWVESILVQPHPGAALLELHDAVRYYQHRDEPDTLATFRRLMTERRRAAECIPPEQVSAQNENWAAEMREQQRFYSERLRAAEEVCAAVRRVDTFEDFSEPVVAGVDGAPDDPTAMNEARAVLTAALRAYDAAKEGAGKARLVTTAPVYQGLLKMEEP